MKYFILLLGAFLSLVPMYAVAQAQEPPASREQISLSYAPVVKRVVPAVVNIYTQHVQKVQTLSPFMDDPFFSQFFGRSFGSMPRERVVNSLGSGVIVGEDGIIVTSYHVVKGSEQITVVLSDKREFTGTVEKADERSDLAVLKVDTKGVKLPALELRDSSSLEVGDLVLAVGNPFGVGQTVTSGIISALARSAESVSDYQFFIQTDAAINPGNSGGALVDMQGKLIGVNTAIYTRSGGYQGIGFAIPAEMVRVVLKGEISKSGHIVRPWFGVAIQPVSREIADAQGLSGVRGVLVKQVAQDSPAEKAGIRAGDILLSLAGGDVTDSQSLNFRIATTGMGVEVPVVLWREGKEITLNVTFGAPPADVQATTVTLAGKHPLNGVVVADMTPEIAEELNLKSDTRAVVVINASKSRMGMNIEPGDIILGINGQEVQSVSELQKALSKRARGFQINLMRGGMSLTMSVM
jgi:Do/DeqQ family serine protease